MAGGDRTGPMGQGPKTGGGFGFCAGSGKAGRFNFFEGGSGRGRGGGMGRGRGSGMGQGAGRGGLISQMSRGALGDAIQTVKALLGRLENEAEKPAK